MNVYMEKLRCEQRLRNTETSLYHLNNTILATPTGEARNHLCNAQIHIMAAQALMQEQLKELDEQAAKEKRDDT